MEGSISMEHVRKEGTSMEGQTEEMSMEGRRGTYMDGWRGEKN